MKTMPRQLFATVSALLLVAGPASAGKVFSTFDVQLRLQASETPYTAFQAQVAYDDKRFSVVDLKHCLGGVPQGHRQSLTTCTNPRPGVIQIAVTNLSDLDAVLPNGELGRITFASKDSGSVGLKKTVTPGPRGAADGIQLNHVKAYHRGERVKLSDQALGISLEPMQGSRKQPR